MLLLDAQTQKPGRRCLHPGAIQRIPFRRYDQCRPGATTFFASDIMTPARCGSRALPTGPELSAEHTRRSASAVLHVIDGDVEAAIEGVTLRATANDTMAVPTHARF